MLSDHEIENPPKPLNADDDALETQAVEARSGEFPLYAVLVAPASDMRAYRPLLDALIGSIR